VSSWPWFHPPLYKLKKMVAIFNTWFTEDKSPCNGPSICVLVSGIVIEVKILLIDQILDHFMLHPVHTASCLLMFERVTSKRILTDLHYSFSLIIRFFLGCFLFRWFRRTLSDDKYVTHRLHLSTFSSRVQAKRSKDVATIRTVFKW
jgi:hypothetical protein